MSFCGLGRYPLLRCVLAFLSLDFLSVFEGEPHIVLAVDSYEIHQSTPEGCIEGVHQVGIFEGGKEILNRCSAGLLAADGLIQGFVPSLGGIEPFCQPIVAFLVTQHITKGCFAFVPNQDFTERWTDEKLYAKYQLTEEEINFIESLIRPIDKEGAENE